RGWIWMVLLALPAAAEELATVQVRITAALAGLPGPVRVLSVQPVAGVDLYEVVLDDGTVLYSTADAGHIIEGDMYRLAGSRLEPLTEASRARLRRETLAAVPLQDMIVFAPKPPQ